MKKRILVLLLVFTALIAGFTVFTACDTEAEPLISKAGELPELTKGYFGTEFSEVTIDLAPYVNKNDRAVYYEATVSDPEVADLDIQGDSLTAVLKKAPATATVKIDAICEGEVWFS